MVLLPRRTAAYRFVAHVHAEALPPVDKTLRVRSTLYDAEGETVAVSCAAVHLGTAERCDKVLELVHEPAAAGAAAPRSFELVATLTLPADPAERLQGALRASRASDGTQVRITGIVDAARPDVVLPEIVLRGV